MSMKSETKIRPASEVAAELRQEAKANDLCGSPEWSALLNEAAEHLESKAEMGEALQKLADTIESHIDGREGWRIGDKAPWIPGANFQDGQIDAGIAQARAALKLAGGGE